MMGLPWFRQGQEYGNGQSGNVEAVRVGGTRPKKQNKLNANDEAFLMAA
jgi:hypothetical protein